MSQDKNKADFNKVKTKSIKIETNEKNYNHLNRNSKELS